MGRSPNPPAGAREYSDAECDSPQHATVCGLGGADQEEEGVCRVHAEATRTSLSLSLYW